MGLDLKGSVSLDGSGFESGIRRIEGSVHHLGSEMKTLALEAFGVAAAGEMIKRTGEYAKQLVNEAKRLGTDGVEGLQVLAQAARDGSTDIESMTTAFEKLDIAREKALSGGEDSQKLLNRFAQLGIGVADLQKMTAAQMFTGPMAKAAGGMNQEVLGPILKDILGKGFGTMIPVLTTDFEELKTKMEGLGAIMSTDTAVKLKQVGDNLDLFRNLLTVALGPAILDFVSVILQAVGWVKEQIANFGAQKVVADNYGGLIPFYKKVYSAEMTLDWNGRFPGSRNKDEVAAANKVMEDYAEAIKIGGEVGKEAADAWAKTMAEMRKRFEDEANRVKNPTAPVFDLPSAAASKSRAERFSLPSDSLIATGNFLGSARDTINSFAQKQVELLQQVVDNTKPLSRMVGGMDSFDNLFPQA